MKHFVLKITGLFCILICSLFMVGCNSVPLADSELSVKAKEFKTDEDKANLYVFRRNQFVGGALKKAIWIDGLYVGRLKVGTFLLEKVEPGEHLISTESEFGNNQVLLNMQPGTNYFLEQKTKWGLFVGGSILLRAGNEEGESEIMKYDLIEPLRKPSVDIDQGDVYRKIQELKNE